MDQQSKPHGKVAIAEARQERLAAALRENLKRRKDQARARRSSENDSDLGHEPGDGVEDPHRT